MDRAAGLAIVRGVTKSQTRIIPLRYTTVLYVTLNYVNIHVTLNNISSNLTNYFLKVLVAQLCPTLCDPKDYSPPGSSMHGILQAQRILKRYKPSFLNPEEKLLLKPGFPDTLMPSPDS